METGQSTGQLSLMSGEDGRGGRGLGIELGMNTVQEVGTRSRGTRGEGMQAAGLVLRPFWTCWLRWGPRSFAPVPSWNSSSSALPSPQLQILSASATTQKTS